MMIIFSCHLDLGEIIFMILMFSGDAQVTYVVSQIKEKEKKHNLNLCLR